jgi:hypothetical protein
MRRQLTLVLWLVVSLVACGPDSPSASTSDAAPSILVVRVGEQVQAIPQGEGQANAFSKAMDLAQANGADLGYPWIDPSSGALVVSAVTDHGRALAQQVGLGIPYVIRNVAYGTAELQQIQDEASQLVGTGVPGADLIYQIMPDHRDNRTLLVIKTSSDPLLQALAARFPEGTLAIEVRPRP